MLAFSASGQSDYGTLVGFIKDTSGSVIPHAKVVIKNEVTGKETATITNDTGYYVISNLPPDYYTITAEATGFKKFESTRNKLDPNSTLSLDTTLSVGAPVM